MEREDRIGAWVSGLAHGALILWALLAGALFRPSAPLPEDRVQVGTMTEAQFQAMAAATRGPGPVAEGAMRPPQAPARPPAQDRAPDTAPDTPPAPDAPPPFGTAPPGLDAPDAAPQAPTIPDAPLSPLALDHSPQPLARPEGLVEAAQARAEAARIAALTAQREAEEAEAARIAAAEAERQAAAERQAEAMRQAEEAARIAEAARQAEAERAADAERQAAAEREAEARRQAEAEAARREQERREQEQLELDRLRLEKLAEQERLAEAARLEEERRREAERQEAERLEAERIEAERLEAARLEAERLEAERLEAARLEAERLEAERLEEERLAEEQRQRELEALAEIARQLQEEQAQDPTEAQPEDELTRALAEALAATPDAEGEFTDPDAIDDPDLPHGPRASGVPDDELTHSLDSARTTTPEPVPDDWLTSAMEGALEGTPEAPSALAVAGSDAPVLTSNELGVLMTHIGECWNFSMLSLDAQDMVISVEVRLDRAGVPLPDSLQLVDWRGGPEAAAQNAFDVASRAIRACGEAGLDLPPEKYDRWKRLILDFDPRLMAARAGG